MGVQGLWRVLESTARPVQLGNLRGKVLAIDASIWIYHFLKAMRDPKGTIMAAAHIIGFFRRICKLLFFEIRPVFVFDGAAPLLKKQTTQKRGERRQGREHNARATANKLLTLQLQRAAALQRDTPPSPPPAQSLEVRGSVPSNAVYMDDISSSGSSNKPADQLANFVKMDQYHLPEINNIAPLRSNDQRMLTEEELQEYSRDFSAQARAGYIDTSVVDFHSAEFERLPIETQYQLLNMARLKSRLRMGYTAEELDNMFPNEMEFSRFQIGRVAQRNFFTQRLMNLVGLEDDLTRRVSSEKNKEYMFKRSDEGWTLSLEDATQAPSASSSQAPQGAIRPLPKPEMKPEMKEESSEDEFEDVNLEPEPQAASEPERPEPTSSDSAVDMTAEDSARLDKLFGYEAKLSREDLYNNMMQEVYSSEKAEADPSQTRSGSPREPRSTLFGNSTSNVVDRSETIPPREKLGGETSHSEQAVQPALDREPPPSTTSSRISTQPVWFEQKDSKFEEMRVQNRRDDPNLVPLDEIADYSDSDENDNIASREGVIASDLRPASNGEVERGGDKQLSAQLPQNEHSSLPSQAVTSEDVIPSSPRPRANFNQPPEPNGPIHDGLVSILEKPDSTDEVDVVSPSASAVLKVPIKATEPVELDPQPPVESLPANLIPAREYSKPDGAVPATEPLVPEIVRDDTPAPLSPEAAARAEEEAKADEDEDEDIAAMLIAEAEENERFAKELAEQNHKAWTDADQHDYNTQISTLRTQFAKETRDAETVSQDMIQECQELLQFFGIPYITAPGEAEAQCAELRSLNLVDGVVTDDGDTFLFDDDAVVYRNMFSQSRFVECYSTKQINGKLGLDRRRLIDLAFLLGSDYTEGIVGIGPVTGVEILAEFGSLKKFAQWWNEAQRFPDSAGLESPLQRRLFKQFKSKLFLPSDFPSQAVTDAYLHPAVDKDATNFNWGVLDIDGLRAFMGATAGWSAEKINTALLPVVQEAKRRELQQKTGSAVSQSRLDDYYSSVLQHPEVLSKRATKATTTLRKKAKKADN